MLKIGKLKLGPLGVLIILVVLGAGVFFGYKAFSGGSSNDSNTKSSSDNSSSGGSNPTSQSGGNNSSTPTTSSGGNKSTATAAPKSNLPKIEVGLVQFGTYLSAVGATHFASDRGVDITIVDLTDKVDQQCDWAKQTPSQGYSARILFTTNNAARVCDGVSAVMILDQSSGADQIITRSDISSFNQLLSSPVAMAGSCSVSEYLYRTIAWSFGATSGSNLKLSAGDPLAARDAFIKDPTIKSLVSYSPYTDDALKAVPGSKVFFDTQHWAGIVDLAVIKTDSNVNPTVQKFLSAWFDFIKAESENFGAAWKYIDEWHSSHQESTAIGPYTADIAKDEITNFVAQASFADNQKMLVQNTSAVEARFNEVDAIQREFPCQQNGKNAQVSSVSAKQMIDGRYIQALSGDSKIQTSSNTVSKRRITLSTSVSLDQALAPSSQQLIGQLNSIYVEFVADKSDFVDENAAAETIGRNFAPILRLTNNTVLQLVGGYAEPRGCTGSCADPVKGAALAIQRANAVRDYLINQLHIPADRIVVSQTARKPTNPQTDSPTLASQDRRVEGNLLVVGGQ